MFILGCQKNCIFFKTKEEEKSVTQDEALVSCILINDEYVFTGYFISAFK